MNRTPRISAINPMSTPLSKTAQAQTWATFARKGTMHSDNASTLWYVLDRCEREGIAYLLVAIPGQGYNITRYHGAVTPLDEATK